MRIKFIKQINIIHYHANFKFIYGVHASHEIRIIFVPKV